MEELDVVCGGDVGGGFAIGFDTQANKKLIILILIENLVYILKLTLTV